MPREDNQRNPVASDLILPLSLGWERHFADDSSFTDFVRDFALTHYELRYYGDAVPTRDYDDTLDFFEVPGTDYMPHRYLHTTHLTEAPNHITYGPLNPFSFFSYFDDLYVDSRILYSRSTDLPIRERRPFIKFQQSHDEMVRDGSFAGCTDMMDYIQTVEVYSGYSFIDAIPYAYVFFHNYEVGDPVKFGLLSGGSWFDCPTY
ncbi:hypothetical protein AAF712_011818 [Marasmius tenuissimus]|uniref:Uncharacterized protein n=1 Tax=Marasmius tenuissimus TaxID=585030 RepID=A0ABR2ZJ44_9AGAR